MNLILLALGCPAPTPIAPDPTAEPTGDTEAPEDTGVVLPEDRAHPDCSEAPFGDEVYDCATLDLAAADLEARQACCACDASLCTLDCDSAPFEPMPPREVSGCETCHGATSSALYDHTGTENPHPFGSAAYLPCHVCHGGDPTPGLSKADAHVPVPPLLSDPTDPDVAFRRSTRLGIETLADYEVDGRTHTAVDWLQFVDPGDLRVTAEARGCAGNGCHADLVAWNATSPMATNTPVLSDIDHRLGLPHPLGETAYDGTAGAYGVSAQTDTLFVESGGYDLGRVPELLAFPDLPASLDPGLPASAVHGQTLDDLARFGLAQVDGARALHAGDDTLGSARGTGCDACHLPRELDGTTTTRDPHVIDGLVEDPHPRDHRIASVARDTTCSTVRGIPDTACAGCHTDDGIFPQFLGVRVDPARDVVGGTQVPAQPVSFATAAGDPRFFDGNPTFAGLTPDQLLIEEDYDGDGRDDTPPDVHQAAGMGCIDCHGGIDVHGGAPGSPRLGLQSHASDTVGITCASCHGDGESELVTEPCIGDQLQPTACATDRFGTPLENVWQQTDGTLVLRSRLDGRHHVVPQLTEVIAAGGAAALAMGRDAATGFSHLDVLACEACHAAWSPATAGRIVTVSPGTSHSVISGQPVGFQAEEAVTYASPSFRSLGVGPRGRITWLEPDDLFFRYIDATGDTAVFTFVDRNGLGDTASLDGRSPLPALGTIPAATHSIRGAASDTEVGVLGCPACHRTTASTEEHTDAVRATAGLGSGRLLFDADGCPVDPLDTRVDRPGCTVAPSANPATAVFALDRLVEASGVENAGARRFRAPGVDRDGALHPDLVGPLGATMIERLTNGIVLDSWYDDAGVLQP